MNLVLLSLAAFVSTNVDSLFVLLALIGISAQQRAVVFSGYLLGSLALIAAAIASSELVAKLPLRNIGLLGILPIVLEVMSLIGRSRSAGDHSFHVAAMPPHPAITVGYAAAVTVASGADNIAVYVPIYAIHSTSERCLITLVLVAMTVPWFAGATYLASHRLVGPHIERHGRALLPWLMIAIGVAVLHESKSLGWNWP